MESKLKVTVTKLTVLKTAVTSLSSNIDSTLLSINDLLKKKVIAPVLKKEGVNRRTLSVGTLSTSESLSESSPRRVHRTSRSRVLRSRSRSRGRARGRSPVESGSSTAAREPNPTCATGGGWSGTAYICYIFGFWYYSLL
jgi:hypothetical protein